MSFGNPFDRVMSDAEIDAEIDRANGKPPALRKVGAGPRDWVIDEAADDANIRDHHEQLAARAASLRLSLKQDLDARTLEVLRDLFLEGKDVEAVAILATELGMAPRDPCNAVLSGNAVIAAGGGMDVLIVGKGIPTRAHRLEIAWGNIEMFYIESVRELWHDREVVRELAAEAFRKYVRLPFSTRFEITPTYRIRVHNVGEHSARFRSWLAVEELRNDG